MEIVLFPPSSVYVNIEKLIICGVLYLYLLYILNAISNATYASISCIMYTF